MSIFADQIAAQRPMLLRIARKLLRNEVWAEDAVSETLLAALENPFAFTGGARLSTWLVAILKHKAIDQIRQHTRERQVHAAGEAFRDADGSETAGTWGTEAAEIDPLERLSWLQFMSQLDRCLQTLPLSQGRAFVLRNRMEKGIAEICDELGVTANHLYVTLHRANRRLRASLHSAWSPVPTAGVRGLASGRG